MTEVTRPATDPPSTSGTGRTRSRARGRGIGYRIIAAGALAARAAPGTIVVYAALTLGAGFLPVVTAWLTKLVLDGLVRGTAFATLVGLTAGLAAVGAILGVSPHLTRYFLAEMDRRVGLLTQDRLFRALDGLPGLARLEDPSFLDRLRLAQHEGGASPSKVVEGVLGTGRAAITIVGFLGSLVLLNPLMTAIVLVSGLPTLAAEISLSRRRARLFWEIGPTERRELFYTDLLSSTPAAKEIRLFGLGAFFRGRMLDERRTANAAKRAVDRREVRVQGGLSLLAAFVYGGGLLWAVGAVRGGTLSIGDITVLVAAVTGVQAALAALTGDIARVNQALLLFDHHVAVTSAEPDLPVTAGALPVAELRDGIEFRDVWFRYSDDHPWILRGVNLRIPHGRAVGLVGLNGAGKSTLVKLICRFYDPTKGAVLWDGVDLRGLDVTQLRQRIGGVFQDFMHYDLTAAENIALGDLTAMDDHDRIHDAARWAGIHEKLSELPRGYRTLLSRMFFMESDKDNPVTGVALSGGQWQRLALARAFLREGPDLVILDEPSSGLDAVAEHEIHSTLGRHRDGRTSLLISHRLSAIRAADTIVVLSDGHIIEEGDHEALLSAGREYARLFDLQASGYRPEEAAEEHVGGTR